MKVFVGVHARHWAVACIAVFYLLLAFSLIVTQKPDIDEGWFSNPAWTLASKGFMGTTVVQESNFKGGRDLTGMNRRTYWIMPLQMLCEAVWFKIFGLGVLQMRLLSALWGLVALFCWWRISSSLLEDDLLATIATGAIAVDYTFVRVAAQGRMDMMCAALGLAGVALYLHFRKTRLDVALLSANCAVATSIFTHPNGILYLFAVVICAATLDLRRLRPIHLVLAGLPYVGALACWGLYIMQAPDIFRRQFAGNAAGRLGGLSTPLASLVSEVRDRYLGLGAGSQHLLKVLAVLPYLLGLGSGLFFGPIRRHPGCRTLTLWALGCFVYFWLFESTRLFLYVVHIAPICLVLLVAGGALLVRERSVLPKWVAVAGGAAFVAIHIGGCAMVARRNTMAPFVGTERFLRQHTRSGELVMASAEYGIPLAFPDNLIDDQRLGCQTGKQPRYIVLNTRYTDWFLWAAQNEPGTYECIQRLLSSDYQVVFQERGITVTQRK